MDYYKLQKSLQNNLFTDIKLTINDSKNKITVGLHKIILYSSCIYFEKLLTSFREKQLNEIIIEVPNTFVTYDIIMSFYGQKTNSGNLPEWEHLLESFRCCDFLGLPFDVSLINNLIF